MRLYLYILEVKQGKPQPTLLFVLYAIDEEDAQNQTSKPASGYPGAKITLKRSESHFTAIHTTYPPYVDIEAGVL